MARKVLIECSDRDIVADFTIVSATGGAILREVRHDRNFGGLYLNLRRWSHTVVKWVLWVHGADSVDSKMALKKTDVIPALELLRHNGSSEKIFMKLYSSFDKKDVEIMQDVLKAESGFPRSILAERVARNLSLRLISEKEKGKLPIIYRKETYQMLWPTVFCPESSDISSLMKRIGRRLFVASYTLAGVDGNGFLGLDWKNVDPETFSLMKTVRPHPVQDG